MLNIPHTIKKKKSFNANVITQKVHHAKSRRNNRWNSWAFFEISLAWATGSNISNVTKTRSGPLLRQIGCRRECSREFSSLREALVCVALYSCNVCAPSCFSPPPSCRWARTFRCFDPEGSSSRKRERQVINGTSREKKAKDLLCSRRILLTHNLSWMHRIRKTIKRTKRWQ